MRSTLFILLCLALFAVVFVSAHHLPHLRDEHKSASQDKFEPENHVDLYVPKEKMLDDPPAAVEIAQPQQRPATRQSIKRFFQKIGRGIKKGFQVVAKVGKGLLGIRSLTTDANNGLQE
ncbi:unnamed protein product [Aphanomyces euteiches]